MSRRFVLTSVLALAIAVPSFAVLNARGQRISQGMPASFGDLAVVSNVEITDESGRVLMSGKFATASDTPSEVERSAELAGAAGSTAKGKADIEIARKNGTVTKDEIELTAEGLPASTALKLMVDSQQASTFTTTSKGKVELKLSRKMTTR